MEWSETRCVGEDRPRNSPRGGRREMGREPWQRDFVSKVSSFRSIFFKVCVVI